MVNSNTYLLIFAVAFLGCVLATPLVTRLATWLGAIDLPDQFRRIHKGATPRMGGLGLAFSLTAAVAVAALGGYLREWPEFPRWLGSLVPIGLASALVLVVGIADDTRELAPRLKLLGQASAVLVLYLGGVRIDGITVMHLSIPLDRPSIAVGAVTVALPGLAVTMLWFLACMNIWNLIDGMDGLASGVGLLVSGTLALVAIWLENPYVAILAAALAGGLAGFLLYNWHPACIFLGDSGSLLIGLLIGVAGVQGSLKEGATIPILFPVLAMGLPISDTAMAIFRRWVRNLPLSSADRRHVHHLLIGLGLTTRQAACMLYCFSAGLCGVVLLGVVLGNEVLALAMGLAACLAFLLILTSRRDELATLRSDFASRFARGKQERFAAKVTWEAIQRVELSETVEGIWEIVRSATARLGCERLRLSCRLGDGSCFDREATGLVPTGLEVDLGGDDAMSRPSATFRLSSGRDLLLTVSLRQVGDSPIADDIAFRFVQRLSLASAERLERLFEAGTAGDAAPEVDPGPSRVEIESPVAADAGARGSGWLRGALGWTSARSAVPARSIVDK